MQKSSKLRNIQKSLQCFRITIAFELSEILYWLVNVVPILNYRIVYSVMLGHLAAYVASNLKTKQNKSLLLQKQYAICPDFCAFKYSDIWKVECLLWHTYPLKNFCSHVCDLSFFKSFVWHLQTVSYEMNRKQKLHIVLIKDRQTCCLFCKK